MKVEEAKKNLENLRESIFTLACEANKYNSASKELIKLREKVKELDSVKKELTRTKNMFDKLSKSSNLVICPNCNGDGGFQWQVGEFEWDGEECNMCKGSGIVNKCDVPQELNTKKQTDEDIF